MKKPTLTYYVSMPEIKRPRGKKGYKDRADYKVHRPKKERKVLKGASK